MPDGYRLTDEDRLSTDARRKREAAIGPVILYGTPSQGEIAQARGAGRGVLVLPEEMRGHIPEMHTDEEWAKIKAEREHPGFEDDGLVSSEWLDKKPEPGEREYEEPRVTDQEPHDHYTQRATRLCAEGDHDSAELWDRDAERIKVRENEAHIREVYDLEESDMATMAEEPIENRLRRAWLNGFKEGVERASYSATESWGRWDS